MKLHVFLLLSLCITTTCTAPLMAIKKTQNSSQESKTAFDYDDDQDDDSDGKDTDTINKKDILALTGVSVATVATIYFTSKYCFNFDIIQKTKDLFSKKIDSTLLTKKPDEKKPDEKIADHNSPATNDKVCDKNDTSKSNSSNTVDNQSVTVNYDQDNSYTPAQKILTAGSVIAIIFIWTYGFLG